MSYKPFLKWVGGKTQILDTVLDTFPTQMHHYHELFLGGGSVLIEFLTRLQLGKIKMSGTIYASDVNPWLIYTYQNVQCRIHELLRELKTLQTHYETSSANSEHGTIQRNPENLEIALEHPENYYYWIRKQFNQMRLEKEMKQSCQLSAMFIFLNKTGFRGVYREGPNGYNVPYGHYRTYKFYDADALMKLSMLFQSVEFRVKSFDEAWVDIQEGDFVYLDPPYAPEKLTSFVGYTADGFDYDCHQRLFQKIRGLFNLGIPFVMSNADVSMVKEAFPSMDYHRKIVVCRRAIHSKDPSSITNELLIYPKS